MNVDTKILLGILTIFGILLGFLPGKKFGKWEIYIYTGGTICMLSLASYAYIRTPKLILAILGVSLSWAAGGVIGWYRQRNKE